MLFFIKHDEVGYDVETKAKILRMAAISWLADQRSAKLIMLRRLCRTRAAMLWFTKIKQQLFTINQFQV